MKKILYLYLLLLLFSSTAFASNLQSYTDCYKWPMVCGKLEMCQQAGKLYNWLIKSCYRSNKVSYAVCKKLDPTCKDDRGECNAKCDDNNYCNNIDFCVFTCGKSNQKKTGICASKGIIKKEQCQKYGGCEFPPSKSKPSQCRQWPTLCTKLRECKASGELKGYEWTIKSCYRNSKISFAVCKELDSSCTDDRGECNSKCTDSNYCNNLNFCVFTCGRANQKKTGTCVSKGVIKTEQCQKYGGCELQAGLCGLCLNNPYRCRNIENCVKGCPDKITKDEASICYKDQNIDYERCYKINGKRCGVPRSCPKVEKVSCEQGFEEIEEDFDYYGKKCKRKKCKKIICPSLPSSCPVNFQENIEYYDYKGISCQKTTCEVVSCPAVQKPRCSPGYAAKEGRYAYHGLTCSRYSCVKKLSCPRLPSPSCRSYQALHRVKYRYKNLVCSRSICVSKWYLAWLKRYYSTPNGSYKRSCRSCRKVGNRLYCYCKDTRGRYRYTRLNSISCKKDIANCNGRLMCVNYCGESSKTTGGSIPSGSYRLSCRSCRTYASGYTCCSCKDVRGRYRRTCLRTRSCQKLVSNCNGRLVCSNSCR